MNFATKDGQLLENEGPVSHSTALPFLRWEKERLTLVGKKHSKTGRKVSCRLLLLLLFLRLAAKLTLKPWVWLSAMRCRARIQARVTLKEDEAAEKE